MEIRGRHAARVLSVERKKFEVTSVEAAHRSEVTLVEGEDLVGLVSLGQNHQGGLYQSDA